MFQVEWLRSAVDELARIWLDSDGTARQILTRAAHEIDERFRTDAQNEGESRANGRRITFIPPLAVTFRIERDGRTVTVIEIRLFRPRPS